jgi:hypothetical protein
MTGYLRRAALVGLFAALVGLAGACWSLGSRVAALENRMRMQVQKVGEMDTELSALKSAAEAEKSMGLGATGKNVGTLGPEDEGQIKAALSIDHDKQMIFFNFGKKVKFVAMTREEAITTAAGLMTLAARLK